jgi:hypothetical protein
MKHPYLRAYLAGIAVPTIFLLVGMTGYTITRYVYDVPLPERVIIFPMAAVPNVWGVWNVIYVAALEKRNVPLGLFGAALPLLLGPAGYAITRLVHFDIPHEALQLAPFALPVGLVLYYLSWKYLVGFLNAELGIA